MISLLSIGYEYASAKLDTYPGAALQRRLPLICERLVGYFVGPCWLAGADERDWIVLVPAVFPSPEFLIEVRLRP